MRVIAGTDGESSVVLPLNIDADEEQPMKQALSSEEGLVIATTSVEGEVGGPTEEVAATNEEEPALAMDVDEDDDATPDLEESSSSSDDEPIQRLPLNKGGKRSEGKTTAAKKKVVIEIKDDSSSDSDDELSAGKKKKRVIPAIFQRAKRGGGTAVLTKGDDKVKPASSASEVKRGTFRSRRERANEPLLELPEVPEGEDYSEGTASELSGTSLFFYLCLF
jgi:hypothetical protein